jgi:hypothetical protein
MVKTFLKTAAAVLCAGIAVNGIAAAQSNALARNDAPVKNPAQMLTSLHAEAIIPVVQELGIQYQGATLPNGQKIVLAQAPNGLKFQLTPTACDEAGTRCRGLHMLALFQTNAPDRTVSAFNYRYAFVSTGLDDTGVAYISRYEIADYGIPRGNVAVALANYLHMASVFDRHLYEATNTVQKNATDVDLAANGLNMQTILADHGLAREVGLSPASHKVSFEALTDVVDTYVRADTLAPGRIVNSVTGKR